jgi:hypothetical protein
VFEKHFHWYRIRFGNYYLGVNGGDQVEVSDEINTEDLDSQLFRIRINPGGSVSFVSKKESNRIVGHSANNLTSVPISRDYSA